MTFGRRAAAALAALLLSGAAAAQEAIDQNTLAPSKDPSRSANGLARTPPMGWNSWNKFNCDIDDRTRFLQGIKALADYVHAKGLNVGIYSDAGRKTCGGRPGYGYQDALTYARWGLDYLKYDWCNTGTRNAEEAYALMADALRSTGRDVVLSIGGWGTNRPWEWGKKIGDLCRTTGDITDKWKGKFDYSWGIVSIADRNEPLWPHAGPGHWNDPDMLAVDQDRLGIQGRRVWKEGDREVWVKPLAGGARAVLLFNRGAAPVEIAADWEQLRLPDRLAARVRDLWAHRDLGSRRGSTRATVAPHAVVMLRVQP